MSKTMAYLLYSRMSENARQMSRKMFEKKIFPKGSR